VWQAELERHGCADDDAHDAEPRPTGFDAAEALSFCDPDAPRDVWLQVGMAYREAGGTWEVWDEWSSKGSKYSGQDDTRAVWESFSDRGGITAGTLVHFAREGGWTPPQPQRPSLEEMFGDVPDSEKTAPPSSSWRYAVAAELLGQAPKAHVENIDDVKARYIYMAGGKQTGMYYDRLTRTMLKAEAFTRSVAHVLDEDHRSGVALFFATCLVRVQGVDYWPGKSHRVTMLGHDHLLLNLWEDDGIKPVKGDVSPWLNHVQWLVPDTEQRRVLLQWMAFTLKHQDEKANFQLLLGGKARIGKDAMLQPLFAGIGPSNTSTVEPENLGEPYTNWAYRKKLANLNELKGAGIGHRRLENRLKPFSAAPPAEIPLRLFGESAGEHVRNIVHLAATTNDPDGLNLSSSPERWFCVWCAPTELQSEEYYIKLFHWLENGGNAAVVHYLLHEVSLEGFNAKGVAPSTPWREQLVDQGLAGDPVLEAVRELHDAGVEPFDRVTFRYKDAMEAVRLNLGDGEDRKRLNKATLTRALYQIGCAKTDQSARLPGKGSTRLRLWCVPAAAERLRDATGTAWAAEPCSRCEEAEGPNWN
jgi:hypothetical protein